MKIVFIILLAGALFPALSQAEKCGSSNSSVAQLEALVEHWAALRLELAGEESAWITEKAAVMDEIKLLRAENEYLEAMIADASLGLEALKEQSDGLAERRSNLQNVLKGVENILEDAEQNLDGWRKRIPPALREEMDALFVRVSMPPEERKKRSVAERVQTVVTLYSMIEDVQNRAHLVTEMIDTPSGRVEMRVLYLGLARGFALTGDYSKAYVGVFSGDGIKWEFRPGLAASLARAIAVYEKHRVPELVVLPLKAE